MSISNSAMAVNVNKLDMEQFKSKAQARRVMDRLMGRSPVTKETKLFSSRSVALGALLKEASIKDYTSIRRYSGGAWGYDKCDV